MAEGAGGTEVGRVSMQVNPNTKGFRRKVEQDLAGMRPIKVDVDPDTKGLRSSVERATKGLRAKVDVDAKLNSSKVAAEAAAAAKAASGYDVDFDAHLDNSMLAMQAAVAAKRASNRVTVKFDTEMDAKGAIEGWSLLDQRVSHQGDIPKLDISTDDFDASLEQAETKMDRFWQSFKRLAKQSQQYRGFQDKMVLPVESGINKGLDKIRVKLDEVEKSVTKNTRSSLEHTKLRIESRSAELTRDIQNEIENLKKIEGVTKRTFNRKRVGKGYDPALHEAFNKLKNDAKSLKSIDLAGDTDTLNVFVERISNLRKELGGTSADVDRFRDNITRMTDAQRKAGIVSGMQAERLKNLGKTFDRIRNKVPDKFDGFGETFRKMDNGRLWIYADSIKQMGARAKESANGGLTNLRDKLQEIRDRRGGVGDLSSDIEAVGRSAKDSDAKMSGFFSKLKKSKKQQAGGYGSRKIMGMSRIGWIVSAVTAVAAPLVQLVSGAVAALPALGGAFLATIGVAMLGWQGIKDAASAAAPALDRAKEAVSGVFRERMTPQFEALGGVLDNIQAGLVGTAHGMADFSQGMVDAISSRQGISSINELLGNTGKLFTQMKPFAEDFTSGLLTMAGAGSRSFGKLAEGMNSFGRTFRSAVEEMSADGSLQQAIESTYTAFGSAFMNIGRIIRAGIESFTPEVAASIDHLFDGFADGIIGLLPMFSSLSTNLFNVLGDLLSGIGQIGQQIGPQLTAVFDSLGPALSDLVNGLASTIGGLAAPIASALEGLAPGVSEVISAIGQEFSDLGADLGKYGPEISSAFQQIGEDISSLLGMSVEGGIIGKLFTEKDVQNLRDTANAIQDVTGVLDSFSRAMQGGQTGASLFKMDNASTWFGQWKTAKREILEGANELPEAIKIQVKPEIEMLEGADGAAEVDKARDALVSKVKNLSDGKPIEPEFKIDPKVDMAGATAKLQESATGLTDSVNQAVASMSAGSHQADINITPQIQGLEAIDTEVMKFGEAKSRALAQIQELPGDVQIELKPQIKMLEGAENIGEVQTAIAGILEGLRGMASSLGGNMPINVDPTLDLSTPDMAVPLAALQGQIATFKAGAEATAETLNINIQPQLQVLDAATSVESAQAAMQEINAAIAAATATTPETPEVTVDPQLTMNQENVAASINTAFEGIGAQAAEGIGQSLGAALGGVVIPTDGLTAALDTALGQVGTTVSTKISTIMQEAMTSIAGQSSSLVPDMSGVVSQIASAFDGAPAAIAAKFQDVGSQISGALGNVAGEVGNALQGAVSEAGNKGTETGNSFAQGIQGASGSVQNAANSLKSAANIQLDLSGSGAAAGSSFAAGILSQVGKVAAASAALAAAARAFFPNSPAKKGPFSGSKYVDRSGIAVGRDFAKGLASQVSVVEDAAGRVTAAAAGKFQGLANDPAGTMESYHRAKVLTPVLESNAKKIADWRKREAEANQKSQEKIDKINAEGKDANKDAKRISEERERLAKSNAESHQKMLDSLEAPDYSKINRSFKAFYIEGVKDKMTEDLQASVKEADIAGLIKRESLAAVGEGRKIFGDHPLFGEVEAAVSKDYFSDVLQGIIKESGIAEVPINFVIANLEQLKSDLGMGDGVVSRAIDLAINTDPADNDTRRYGEPKEIHYHVADMEEAIRLEEQRERKESMKIR